MVEARRQQHAPRFDELNEAARAELWAVLALRHTEGLGARSHIRLIRHFGSAFTAVKRAPHLAGSGVRQQAAQKLASGCWRATAKAEWDALRTCDCGILLWNDPCYPERLRSLPDAPALLYCKGDVALLDNPALGVVGSRLCSRQGMRMAAKLARDLACAGVTIVSGMARGIDREAHLAGLQGIGGTVGVLGTGIDVRYPYDNEDLFDLMACDGLLVTEFAPGARPEPRHFPIRNRVISGLSLGVLVVEAATRSGSLITARLALEQGREVYAMPGPVSAQTSRGCHDLLEEGAHAVGSAEDILVDLAPQLLGALRDRSETATAASSGSIAVDGVSASGFTVSASAEGAMPDAGVGRLMDRMRQHLARHDVPDNVEYTEVEYTEDAHAGGGGGTNVDGRHVRHRSCVPSVTEACVAQRTVPVPLSAQKNELPVVPPASCGQSPAMATGSQFASAPSGGDVRLGAVAPVATVPVVPAGNGASGLSAVTSGTTSEHCDPESRLLALLRDMGEAHVDDLCRALAMAPGDVSGTLLLLEVQGVVRRLPGMRYASM